MGPVNYFDLPEVSSSDLGALKRTFYGLPDNRGELAEAFAFGSLVDAMLTEKHRVNYSLHTLDDGDKAILFDGVTWRHALRLAEDLAKDPIIARLLPFSIGQYIVRRTLDFFYEGELYQIKGKCKFDLLARSLRMSLDFKTTSCTTLAQFIESIFFFDYDKQGAYYMDLGRVDYHWICGISKKNGKIFKFVMQRGDEAHKSGIAKYSVWAYRWNMLIDPFAKAIQDDQVRRANGLQFNQIFIDEVLNLKL